MNQPIPRLAFHPPDIPNTDTVKLIIRAPQVVPLHPYGTIGVKWTGDDGLQYGDALTLPPRVFRAVMRILKAGNYGP